MPKTYSCPAELAVDVIGGRWRTVILSLLKEGVHRYGELRRRIPGVSEKMLTQRLRELEADGLVWREHEPTIPPKVTYGLTEMGRDVHTALKAFDAPTKRWLVTA